MVDVKVASHFNEDGYSHGLALGLADRLRDALGDVTCAEHTGEPEIQLSTEGVAQTLNDIHIEIIACCESLHRRVEAIVQDAVPGR